MGMRLHPDLVAKILADAGVQPDVSEKEFMGAVVALAKRNGWLIYHAFDSRKSEAGFPDLLMIRGPRLIVAELKVGDNRPTAPQANWLDAFQAVPGVQAYLWKPENWAEILEVLT